MCSKSFILFVLAFQVKRSVAETCDKTERMVPGGNLGQAGAFPWLGLIRVHLHEGTKLRIALTGAVLVRATFAIAVADEIAKIPRKIFQHDSKAMFFVQDTKPWLFSLKDYLLHPEYELDRLKTIALIELEPDELKLVSPICWPTYMFNASNQLYALGYTDEKEILEKEIHRMQYVDKRHCEEYYRAERNNTRYTPTCYVCGFSVDQSAGCEWDSGMVLASNASGPWVLIGLGVFGAGCAAPSRFIEVFQYLQWIESSTTNVENGNYRKSAFGTGFEQKRIKNIPVHEFFRTNNSNSDDDLSKEGGTQSGGTEDWYSDFYYKDHYEFFKIEHLDWSTIQIQATQTIRLPFKNKFGSDCESSSKTLLYTETVKIYSSVVGFAYYQLSLMDLMLVGDACVLARVEAPEHDDARIWYKVGMKLDEPLDMLDRSPTFHIKHYPMNWEDSNKKEEKGNEWKHYEPRFVIDDKNSFKNRSNVNLYLKVKFKNEAYLKVQIWAPPVPMSIEKPTEKPNFRFKSQDKDETVSQPNIFEHDFKGPLLRRINSTGMPLVEDNSLNLRSNIAARIPIVEDNLSTRTPIVEDSLSTTTPIVEDSLSTRIPIVEDSLSRLRRIILTRRPHLGNSSSHLKQIFSTGKPHVVDSFLHLQRIFSTRRPHVEAKQDEVAARVVEVRRWSNRCIVHTETLCFLAFLHFVI